MSDLKEGKSAKGRATGSASAKTAQAPFVPGAFLAGGPERNPVNTLDELMDAIDNQLDQIDRLQGRRA